MVCGLGRHFAESLNGHGLAGKRLDAPDFFGASLHSHVNAQPGHYGSVTAPSGGDGQADHVVCLLLNVFHVPPGATDIGGGQVASAQGVDEPSVCTDEGFCFVGVGVSDDHAFSAAEGKVGRRCFIGHGPGQPERVPDRFLLRLIGPNSCAATGWSQSSVMDGDDSLEA